MISLGQSSRRGQEGKGGEAPASRTWAQNELGECLAGDEVEGIKGLAEALCAEDQKGVKRREQLWRRRPCQGLLHLQPGR